MKHLPGHSRIALGNRRLRAAVGIGVIAIRPRDGRQPGAPAANKTRPLGDGKARVERPIGNLVTVLSFSHFGNLSFGNLSFGELRCGRA